ncbi:hypothetical protein NQ314_014500 [Rhamnusium bicolor]|uniref:Uncharacterized protein n=1 Tax=Rhamnusium bicolor TaxID=1586634 RepID=A0AAV8X2S5_9CUCU|nr:hypothetical protein NQ314_014500 [Rhamnusium bicolor]
MLLLIVNSKTSTLWKLNSDRTKIIEANPFHPVISYSTGNSNRPGLLEDDPLFDIIASTEHFGQSWVKQGVQYYCTSCKNNEIK